MSDEIIINITPDPSINISAVDSNESITISSVTINEGLFLTEEEANAKYVSFTGNQNISGIKTFNSPIILTAGSNSIALSGYQEGEVTKLSINADSIVTKGNAIGSKNTAVIAGSGNLAQGDYNFIGGGLSNEIYAEALQSFIGGGGGNAIINGLFNAICAGGYHNINNGDGHIIVGGYSNSIENSDQASAVLGGKYNVVNSSNWSSIGGGSYNQIISSNNSFTAGGTQNIISGDNGAVLFGDGQSRNKYSQGDHTLTFDFASGVYIPTGTLNLAQRPIVNGTGVMLSGEAAPLPTTIVYQTGDQTISGSKLFIDNLGIGQNSATAKVNVYDTTLAASGSLSGSAFNIAQTWNTSGTPTAIKLNITDTASNAASLLMDLQVGGNRMFSVSKTGTITFATGGASNGLSFTRNSSNNWTMGSNGVGDIFKINGNTVEFPQNLIASRQGIIIKDIGQSTGAWLLGEASHVLAQRNGTNAQTFRLYNTFTDASNYERGFLRWDTNVLKIGAEALGTGTNRNIEFVAGGSTRMTITSSGNIGIGISSPDANTLLTVNDSSTAQKNVSIDIRNGNYGWWRVTSSNTNNAGKLSFSSNNSGQTPLVLDGAGYVGIGAATPTAKLDILDTALAGSGSLAGSALNIAQTWNTTGTPTAIKLNITDTASNAASLLMDLQVGGVSKARVDKDGSIYGSGSAGGTFKLYMSPSGYFQPSRSGNWIFSAYPSQFMLPSDGYFGWAVNSSGNSVDLTLYKDAANQLAQRNSTNAQTFRIYNTYTDASNYERGFLRWNTNVLEIGTEAAGTGSSRNLQLLTGGTARWIVDTSGRLVANGQYGVFSMWQGGFNVTSGGTSVIARFYGDSGHTRISSSETSLCLEIPRLTFNGTTSSFPAIKRSATTLQIRLADDSGDASLTAANITCSGHLAAATKSFKIPHQTKSGYLQYGVVESNEHSVYVRGKTSEDTITLPDHWDWLVDENSVTVQVTPIGKPMSLWVIEQTNKVVKIGGIEGSYNYTIYGTRKDVPELEVELES